MGRLSWVIWGGVLSAITFAFMREAEGDVTHRREEDVTTEAEVGVMWPQAAGISSHQKQEEARPSHRASGDTMNLPTP